MFIHWHSVRRDLYIFRPNSVIMALSAIVILMAICLQVSQCHQAHVEHYPHQYNPYSFGYDVDDQYGAQQWRQEESHNPNEVHGSYGYRDNNGHYREVTYVADKNGFRAKIKTNEPGLAGAREPASVKLDSYHPSSSKYTRQVSSPPVYHSIRA